MQLNIAQFAVIPPDGSWSLAAPRRAPAWASLTDVLPQIPEFTRSLLPNARRVVTAVNRAARAGNPVPPSDATRAGSLYSVVGQSVDRGALFFSGADVVAIPLKRLRSGSEPAQRIARVLETYRCPRSGGLRNQAFLGWLTLLGMLEPVLRGFRPLSDIDVSQLPKRPNGAASAIWLSRIVPATTLQEIAELLRRVRDTRVRGHVIANPVFGGIGPVIGSDGDWIAGRTLVELKCTVSGMKSIHVAQLICYFVFDQMRAHGRQPYGFDSLALSLPRQGVTVVGAVDDWLSAFGAPSSATVVPAVAAWLDSDPLVPVYGVAAT